MLQDHCTENKIINAINVNKIKESLDMEHSQLKNTNKTIYVRQSGGQCASKCTFKLKNMVAV